MNYAVAEVFVSLQGEGFLAGTPAAFLRLGGCNMWSGFEATRDRDAQRNGASCPAWCDTDFRSQHRWSVNDVRRELSAIRLAGLTLLVVTGGEPLLQLDDELAFALVADGWRLALETNGTIEPSSKLRDCISWICCSPKVPVERLLLQGGDELKVVVPAYDPRKYEDFGGRFKHWFVQPCEMTKAESDEAMRWAIQFCLNDPRWRMSLQMQKLVGIR